jgi:hypothetical protein
MMLLDDFLPTYQFNEVHKVPVRASLEKTFAAIKELTPSELSPWVTLLLGIRALPAWLTGKQGVKLAGSKPMLDLLCERGIIPLAETPNREVVFGAIGQFWKPTEFTHPSIDSPQAFLDFNHPDFAKLVTNLAVLGNNPEGNVFCVTETRIYAPDQSTRSKFAIYWRIISFGSGFIRLMWLKAIKRRAERVV